LHLQEVRFLSRGSSTVAGFILIDAIVGLAIFFLWYAWFIHYNRRRAGNVLEWVEAACLGKGEVVDLRWQANSSKLRATLHLSSRWFEDARLTIRLLPRPLPFRWAMSHWRRQQETLTFEADMGFPPGFHLDVIRHRWAGQSGSGKVGSKGAGSRNSTGTRAWTITRPGPVILTTKEDWPAELSPVVNALASWRDKDFVGVRFNSKSPHFTATVALENLSDQKAAASLLGLFRELAASSSAKQH
jgi:hypothetical protein